jgi:hypothetical protein
MSHIDRRDMSDLTTITGPPLEARCWDLSDAQHGDSRSSRRPMRSLLVAALLASLMTMSSGLTVIAQTASPAPPSPVSLQPEAAVPTAMDAGEALGTEVEAMGIRADMSQLWEGVETEPGAVTAAHMQSYRWVPGGSEDIPAFAIVEIVRFRNADEAAIHGGTVAAAIGGSLSGFETDLSAELVVTGSFISEEGFGGSTILVLEGAVVAIVTAFRTGSEEMEQASTALAALVLDRLRGLGRSAATRSAKVDSGPQISAGARERPPPP